MMAHFRLRTHGPSSFYWVGNRQFICIKQFAKIMGEQPEDEFVLTVDNQPFEQAKQLIVYWVNAHRVYINDESLLMGTAFEFTRLFGKDYFLTSHGSIFVRIDPVNHEEKEQQCQSISNQTEQ